MAANYGLPHLPFAASRLRSATERTFGGGWPIPIECNGYGKFAALGGSARASQLACLVLLSVLQPGSPSFRSIMPRDKQALYSRAHSTRCYNRGSHEWDADGPLEYLWIFLYEPQLTSAEQAARSCLHHQATNWIWLRLDVVESYLLPTLDLQ